MIKTIMDKLRKIAMPSYQGHSGLEQFIIEGNPQNSNDIERLEKQYYDRQSLFVGVYNYFPNGGTHR